VYGVLEIPHTPGPHPAVVILSGSAGWRPEYASIAKVFADSGFVSLAIDYYAETGRDTRQVDKLTKWPQWQATVRNAVAFLKTQPSSYGCPVGLIGYSRGAFLAVSVASSIPEVKAVVDFFGGGGSGKDPLESEVIHFPPLLILHGEADKVVSVKFAQSLRDAVISQGGEVEMYLYPNEQHAFNATWSPTFSESAASDSFRRTIDFLQRRLKN
jgi:carboxymethylenebutenolidase